MKNFIIGIIAFCLTICVVVFYSYGGKSTKKDVVVAKPLNVSVYLDLSDRLVRDLTPNQTYRDTAIINYLIDYFKGQTLRPKK